MKPNTYITFPRENRDNPWHIGRNTWRRMTEPTRAAFRAKRDKKETCKLRIDVEPPTLGEA